MTLNLRVISTLVARAPLAVQLALTSVRGSEQRSGMEGLVPGPLLSYSSVGAVASTKKGRKWEDGTVSSDYRPTVKHHLGEDLNNYLIAL